MDTQSLLAVVDLLEADGIDVWLDGGWGVDALLERQTRDMTTSTSWSNLPTLIALSNCSAASDIHRLPAPHERASSWSTCEGAKSTFTR